MTSSRLPWVTENNIVKQTLASLGAILVGAALAYGFRGFSPDSLNNEFAGFGLGVMLLVIGAGGILFNPRQTTTVDPTRRLITIETRARIGRGKVKTIRFDEIDHVGLGRLGSRSDGSVSWHVVLTLKTGKELGLFTGFHDGAYNRMEVEKRADRLKEYLG